MWFHGLHVLSFPRPQAWLWQPLHRGLLVSPGKKDRSFVQILVAHVTALITGLTLFFMLGYVWVDKVVNLEFAWISMNFPLFFDVSSVSWGHGEGKSGVSQLDPGAAPWTVRPRPSHPERLQNTAHFIPFLILFDIPFDILFVPIVILVIPNLCLRISFVLTFGVICDSADSTGSADFCRLCKLLRSVKVLEQKKLLSTLESSSDGQLWSPHDVYSLTAW